VKNDPFTVYPAIDLHHGQVVRLQQGDREKRTDFNLKPENAAEKWISEGAKWLHTVNLDGAFGEDSSQNIKALKRILLEASGSAKVQFGGGVRDLAAIKHLLKLGVYRVILGTAAVRDPVLMSSALEAFGPQKIVLGVDARDGLIRIAGWEEKTTQSPIALIKKFVSSGLKWVIFTNIRRDGMGTGVDVNTSKNIAAATGVNVIASGGVASLQDIQSVKSAGLAGVIVGRALYQHHFTLAEALQC